MADEKFSYSYSAKQQAEVKKIREKYAGPLGDRGQNVSAAAPDASASKPGMVAGLGRSAS